MLESTAFLIFISAVLGFLSGLGVGGGSLLILWLTVILGTEHSQARIINLLFFLPSAVVTSLFRIRQGALSLKKALPAIIAGCLAAAGFSVLGMYVDNAIIKKLFGGLLLIAGLKELLYKKPK